MKPEISSYAEDFKRIVSMIQEARLRAYAKVNEELITLYYNVGKFVSQKVESAEWGSGVVDKLAQFIRENHPEIRGFTRRGLYRMKQFYETYKDSEIVSALRTQLSWTHHRLILAKTKTMEEKEFYIKLAIKEKWSSRELERQLNAAVYERSMLANKIVSPVVAQFKNENIFKDTYVFEFLDLPENYSEKDLRKALVSRLKDFILELGRGFSFVGEEYRIEVGNHDYYIDLLFFHRDLRCLVAVELKIEEFQPEFIGKMNFYLEALDREVKKAHENPSVGILLCKGKDEEVVEFALARNISPTMIADYETKLIDKKLLRAKLHELIALERQVREAEVKYGR
jgi:predicted nuclease of restriction endonuclease-like (RecB) superfamily